MSFPRLLRRSGAVPALVRLIALLLGCISLVLLAGHGHPKVYTTDYLILGYLILVDFIEIACLCGQPRGWPLSALPMLIGADTTGLLMLVCSRDWYGLWYWHGPYYSLGQEIGMGLFIALPNLRIILVVLASLEYWYESREDRYLAAERESLLP